MTINRRVLELCAWVSVVGLFLGGNSFAQARTLSIDDRVAAQKAIEQVYWSHRIWPTANPGPKPELSAVMPDDAVRAKVEDDLKKSNALETWWHRPVTAEQLQAELDRMTQSTRDGATLNDLYHALGDDPYVIAETLARPTLVDRLIRSWYANDTRIHGALRAKAETALAACASLDCMATMGGAYRETTWKLRVDGADVAANAARDDAIRLGAGEWKEHLGRLAARLGAKSGVLPAGRLSGLEETSDAFVVTAVLAQKEGELTTASVVWPKRSFDAWWSVEKLGTSSDLAATVATYDIAASISSPCAPDTWATTQDQPEGRYLHTAVWTGTEMIVWGGLGFGYSNSGGRYNPATDTWTATSMGANVPAGRNDHVAVWTGTEMIVWGGNTMTAPSQTTGGRYNPATDSWLPTSTGVNVPAGRRGLVAVWTGSKMVVWGGTATGGPLDSGGRYDPSTDSWLPTSRGANVPSPREAAEAVWTGTEMIVYGGRGSAVYLDGARYNPTTDTWAAMTSPLPTLDFAPFSPSVWTGTEMIVMGTAGSGLAAAGRYNPVANSWTQTSEASFPGGGGGSAVWSGTEMIVWGGGASSTLGGRYNPSTNVWVSTSTGANVPEGRSGHTAVWTGTEMIVWGGQGSGYNNYLSSGGRYRPSSNSWIPTHATAGPAKGRSSSTAVWTGTEMILWGGSEINGSYYLNSGFRYSPATNSWMSTSQGLNVPAGRNDHTAVWTGAEMIVWGGLTDRSGGRYNPSTDSWTPTSLGPNVPASQYDHTAVWTGTEMIIWGGWDGAVSTSQGARYSPSTNSWAATSTGANVPLGRQRHTAVWTGTEMIVWGGWRVNFFLSTGGRYNPSTNSWAAMASGGSEPSPRYWHTAVWTGREMIVWGGYNFGELNTGGRYNPSTDGWATTTAANVPSARYQHTAVWTGAEMIVWGGSASDSNTGGRYNPSTDGWSPTSTAANVPIGRQGHDAVWTGTQMIIWGGAPSVAAGVYCACPGGRIVYRDTDGDGYGNPAVSAATCDGTVPAGYTADATDCDDANAAVHPGATEVCNGIDDNCDGIVDNGGAALCHDGNVCTDDACNGASGCLHANNTAPCDDGNLCTNGDVCNAGVCAGIPGPPPEIRGVSVTGHGTTILTWTGPGGGTKYDVASSTLSDLAANSTTAATCFANDVVATSLGDARATTPGDGYYYLIRAQNVCGTGSYGFATSGAERVPTAACP